MRKTINGSPGLYTAANAEILPPGSLSVAKGVVIRRPGLIQKARPFRQFSYGGDSALNGTVSFGLGYFSSHLYLATRTGALYRDGGLNGVFASLSCSLLNLLPRFTIVTEEANNNFYIAGGLTIGSVICAAGKVDAAAGTPYQAGCPRALDPIVSLLSSGTLLSSGQSVSYRAVYTLTDANSNFVFGAPSGPVTLTATGAQDGQAKVLLHPDIYNAANATSYRVQLYRSNIVATGSNPDDEMQLVADYGITSTDVSNKYVTISDNTPDNLKGILGSAYLYTNPSQGTIAVANYQPPLANDIALFKASMFYANTTQKHRASLTMLAPPEAWAIQSIAANTPIAGQSTYTFPAAVDLTGFDNTMKLAVVSSTGASNDGTWPIVSVNNAAHTVVVTNAGVAQAAPAGSAMSGKLTIGNTAYFPIFGTSSVANHYYTVPSTGTSQAKVSAATISLVQIINQTTSSNVVAYNVTSPLTPAGEMQFEEASIGGSAFTAKAEGTTTAGYRGAYSITFAPAIPAATPLTSKNDAKKNRLHISKTGQPEHCPLSDSYFFDIGSASKAILRLIPLRNALLVFKEDGLFRVTGDAGVFSWAPFDPTQQLLLATLAEPLNNTAIALTNRGVWQFSETASRYISGPVSDKIDVYTSAASSSRNVGGGNPPSRLSVNASDGTVFLYVNSSVNPVGTSPETSLVYSVDTGAWTEQYTSGADSDGITGQAEFASMCFVQVNGTRFGVMSSTVATGFARADQKTCDVYEEDQYAFQTAPLFAHVSGVDFAAADGAPVPGHKYMLNVTAVDTNALTMTATVRGGPAIAVGDIILGYGNVTDSGNTSAWKVTAVNGSVYTLAYLSGASTFVSEIVTGSALKHLVAQPIQIDYNPFSNGDDGSMSEFTEVAAILDPLSMPTMSSVSIGCYSENWSSSQMTMQPVTNATTFNRIGVEGNAQVARHLSVRITHSNPLEYFYLRGVSYLVEPVEGSVATN